MEIYFDNVATTRFGKAAAGITDRVAREDYGNPSSLHLTGVRTETTVRTTAEQVVKTLKMEPAGLIFTSGGMESDNLAIPGTACSRKGYGRHLITNAIEYPAVLETIRFLEEQDLSVTVLPVDTVGRIALSGLEATVRKDTTLVSLMHVNNEIGTIQPVAAAAELVYRLNPDCYSHTDAVQVCGKSEIYPKRLGIDLLSAGSHKVAGPKGVGFLYKNRCVSLKPVSFGGGQQGGPRSGTLNASGTAGMGEAMRKAYPDFPAKRERLLAVKNRTLVAVLEIPGVSADSVPGMGPAPQILSLPVEGVCAEVLPHAFEVEGVFVSSDPVCASNHPGIPATLRGTGLPKQPLDATIRLSFSAEDTEAEAECFSEVFRRLVPKLRKLRR